MATSKAPLQQRTNTQTREILLGFFYQRNAGATSARGKRGTAVKINDVKKELNSSHGLTQQQVQSNLTYERALFK